MRCEQRVGVGRAVEGLQPFVGRDQRARQRVAVGVQTDRRQPDDRVARRHAFAIGHVGDVDDADDRARQIEIAGLVQPGHLRGFAAQQRHRVRLAGAMARPRTTSAATLGSSLPTAR